MALAKKIDQILRDVDPSFLSLVDRKELAQVLRNIDDEGDSDNIYPSAEHIFEWLKYFSVDKTVGMVCGQDPYPENPIGICFAKNKSDGFPKSFQPIVNCLEKQKLMRSRDDRHANLMPWVAQGLLMPNMALTNNGTAKSHQKIWRPFMKKLIPAIFQQLKKEGKKIFVLLWGAEALQIGPIATKHGHEVFTWSHPSPLSDNKQPPSKKFVNCDNFASANDMLIAAGMRKFVWDNMGKICAFSDGACSGNGKAHANATYSAVIIGGHFGYTNCCGTVRPFTYEFVDEKNPAKGFRHSETSKQPSNNRGELLGICWALFLLIKGWAVGEIELISDSNISVRTLNEWLPGRRKKGTQNDLQNFDLLVIAETYIKMLKNTATKLTIIHTPASHDVAFPSDGTPRQQMIWKGNADADTLAKKASDLKIPHKTETQLPALLGST